MELPPEEKVDTEIAVETRIVAGAAATYLGAKLSAIPAAVALANAFGGSQQALTGYAEVASAIIIATLCGLIHRHFYNGSVKK